MITYIVLTILFILAVTVFHYCAIKRGPRDVVLTKGIASLIFVIVGALGMARFLPAMISVQPSDAIPFIFMFAGLCCGLAGDVLLAFRNISPARKNLFIIFGIIAFALGHICYSVLTFDFYSTALAYDNASTQSHKNLMLALPFLLSVPLTGIILATAPCLKLDFGKLKPGVAIYTYIIFIFITSAISSGIMAYANANYYHPLFFIIPVLLFASSDFMLSQNYFDKENKHNEPKHIIAIHVTYYLAQYMFASILYFL
ncbi:MAG: hypothetical protein IJ165_00885 [Proteobacteria bacterium]|nr:hypothetical protein [Pseudomonadota bacterium]